jgi:hypothetical protein
MNRLRSRILWVIYVLVVGWFGFGLAGWQFVIGSLIALVLGLVDRFIYAWWLYPFEQSSIQIQYWTRKRDAGAVLGLLMNSNLNQQKLIFRSLGFAAVWVLLAWYVSSSTGSIVAMGIVMGLGFDLLLNILKDWNNPGKLGGWFCWQIKRPLSVKEVHWCGGVFVGLWAAFALRLALG